MSSGGGRQGKRGKLEIALVNLSRSSGARKYPNCPFGNAGLTLYLGEKLGIKVWVRKRERKLPAHPLREDELQQRCVWKARGIQKRLPENSQVPGTGRGRGASVRGRGEQM